MDDAGTVREIRAIVVDDQDSQLQYVIRNLETSLFAQPGNPVLNVIQTFNDTQEAIKFIQRSSEVIDLVVTDLLWPKEGAPTPKQVSLGTEVVRYVDLHRKNTLIVALTLGGDDMRIARDAVEAGAHIFRFHDIDLPGERGAGWIDLALEIVSRLDAGPPFTAGSRIGRIDEYMDTATGYSASSNPMDIVERICRRFPIFVSQLNIRHNGRTSIQVADEYDVQDLLHAILRIHFDDVRDEETAPSHGDTQTRLDLLLKGEKVVIEVKMTRPTLGQKKLVEEISVDKERYRSHPDCGSILFFVFDPGGHLSNPNAIERDLSGTDGIVETRIVIAPDENRSAAPSPTEQ